MTADGRDAAKAKVVPLKGNKCPICGKAASLEMRPFCSKRCADLDLGRWLGGDYRLPTNEVPGEADAGQAEDDEGY